ncbi:MAG: RNA methyltransferase [Rhodothermales bacterium]|nr:RNA methyltransferase [Rhodothermales bacterium]
MTHISAQRLKQIASLKRKRNRDEYGEAVVEGVRSVQSLVQSGWAVSDVILSSDFEASQLSWVQSHPEVRVVSKREFEKISNVQTGQGILAVVRTSYVEVDNYKLNDLIVALDGVADPGNVGTIIRSAAWFGIRNILCGTGTADPFNAKTIRASMGGLWDVQVTRPVDLPRAIQHLKTQGMVVMAADLEGATVDECDVSEAGMIVIGSEAHGISADVANLVDQRIVINKRAKDCAVESLNAATASSIIMEKWTRSGPTGS